MKDANETGIYGRHSQLWETSMMKSNADDLSCMTGWKVFLFMPLQ